jgi:hypothetical protein
VEVERKLGFGTSGQNRARIELRRKLRVACETRPRVGERSFEEARGVRGIEAVDGWMPQGSAAHFASWYSGRAVSLT